MRIRLRYLATFLMVSWVVVTFLYLLPLILSFTREEKVVSINFVLESWTELQHKYYCPTYSQLGRGLEGDKHKAFGSCCTAFYQIDRSHPIVRDIDLGYRYVLLIKFSPLLRWGKM